MKRIYALLLVSALMFYSGLSMLYAQASLDQVYYSGITHEGNLGVLANSFQQESILYYSNSTIQSATMTSYLESEAWKSASIPVPDHPYIGFRGEGQNLRINPIYWQSLPSVNVNKLTQIVTDPAGDHSFNLNHLDLRAFHVAFTEDKIYFGIQNNGGGFPVSSGFTYFSYMAIMVNPDADPESNPPVFGLMYTVNLAGVISPGLYKITGTGFSSLQSIGSIESSIDAQNNMLYLSCNISDLLNNPDFTSWFNPQYPLVGTMAISSRITLTGGIQEADQCLPANLLLKPQQIQSVNNNQPVLTNLWHDYSDGSMQNIRIGVSYYDPDFNFPLNAEILIDNNFHGNMYPIEPLSFSTTQAFESGDILLPPLWDQIQLRFSDDGQNFVYETIINNTSITGDLPAQIISKLYPNPAKDGVKIQYTNNTDKSKALTVYNLRGQIQMQKSYYLAKGDGFISLDTSSLRPGMYIVSLGNQRVKIVKMD